MLHKYPYYNDPSLHFYAGLLTLLSTTADSVLEALSADGRRAAVREAQEEEGLSSDSADESEAGSVADADADDDNDSDFGGMSQRSVRSHASSTTSRRPNKVIRKRGLTLAPQPTAVRRLPTNTLAAAKRHFEACVLRAHLGGADASDAEAGASGWETDVPERKATVGFNTGGVGFQNDARLERRTGFRIAHLQKSVQKGGDGKRKALGLPSLAESGKNEPQTEEAATGAAEDEEEEEEDPTLGARVLGLQSHKRRRASSADLEEYSSEDELDERDREASVTRTIDVHYSTERERLDALLQKQRRLLKAGGHPLASEGREQRERALEQERRTEEESMFEAESDEENQTNANAATGRQALHSDYWRSQGRWAAELAQVYIDLVSQSESAPVLCHFLC